MFRPLRFAFWVVSGPQHPKRRFWGSYTSLAVAAAVGGTTAVTVSLGSRLVDVTIKYGGALTKAAAEKIATAYLQFKASGDQTANTGECIISEGEEGEDGWIVMDCSSGKEILEPRDV
jgi:hypothetical protein